MIYAPHILQKKVVLAIENDEYGQPIFDDSNDWEDVCVCRCDDKSTEWRSSENGSAYITNHYVVCDGKVDIKEGDYVRCVGDGVTKAEGEVYMVRVKNYFGYTEIYL